jgi:hypothetical protein
VPKLKVSISTPFCCMCSTTLKYVRDKIATLQLGFGQICDGEGSGGGPSGPVVAVIWPLRGGIVTAWPCKGPNVTCLGGGLLPPGFIHCKFAVPPDDERNASETILASPAALKLAAMLKFGFFTIVGVPIKCGLAAKTTGDVIMANAAITVPTIIPEFNLLSCLLVVPQLYHKQIFIDFVGQNEEPYTEKKKRNKVQIKVK